MVIELTLMIGAAPAQAIRSGRKNQKKGRPNAITALFKNIDVAF